MAAPPFWNLGDPPPALPAGDPLVVVRNPAARHERIIGILCETEGLAYPVRAVIDASCRNSAIPEALAVSLGLQCYPAPPSTRPGFFAVVPVVDAMESCGIPDMRFRVRVVRGLQGWAIYLGSNALENAVWERAG